MTLIHRRDFVSALGLSVLSCTMPGRLLANPRFAKSPFTLGVAAGDPLPNGFVLWTRLAPEPLAENGGMPPLDVPVRWEVSEDPHFRQIVQKGQTRALAALAHSVHVEVGGLRPHRPHWYRFIVEGAGESPVGKARTAPAPDAAIDRLRLAVAGCQNFEVGYFSAFAHIAAEPDLDAVFHYGDYIYEFGPRPGVGPRVHQGDETQSLADYRQRYAQYKTDPDLQAAHAAAAFIMSFDDHEIDDNWGGIFDKDGSTPADFAKRRSAAMQAWYEHMPVRRSQVPEFGGRMYRQLDYGQLLRMHVLDTRSHRSDQLCERPGVPRIETIDCLPVDRPDRSLLGFEQEKWLDSGLGNQRRWNLIAQQVMMMPHDARKDGGTRPVVSADNWNGYSHSRQRLIDSIRRHDLKNVVVASGDVHQHFVGSVPVDAERPDGPSIASEFLATSISSGGTGGARHPDEHNVLDNNPHMKLINNQRGYQMYNIAPDRWTTEVKVMDQVDQPGGRVSTLARFAVDPARPGVEHW